eukprot:4299344-Heterocapsa_arctica.AAC.1
MRPFMSLSSVFSSSEGGSEWPASLPDSLGSGLRGAVHSTQRARRCVSAQISRPTRPSAMRGSSNAPLSHASSMCSR